MKLKIAESTTGLTRNFDGGSQDMTVQYFINKISDMYHYDKNRVKVLFMSQVLNKNPDQKLTYFGVKPGDTVHVLNFQAQNSYVTHLNYLQEQHKKGILKVKKLPSQVQPKLTAQAYLEAAETNQGGSDFQQRLINSLSDNFGMQRKSYNSNGSNINDATFSHTRNLFTSLYSKFTGQPPDLERQDQHALKEQMGQNSANKSKKSPFKKAGDYLIRRMSNLNSSGENADRSANEDDGEIFSEADCQNGHQRFYRNQISDTYGKEDVDEKLVAKITGAKEVLKKPRRDRLGIFGEHADVNIMDLLQLFRESHENRGGRGHHGDSLPQMLMAVAQSGHDGEYSGDELDSANYFGEENDDNPLGNPFSLMRISNAPGHRDREQQRAAHGLGASSGSRPSFGRGLRRAERPDQFGAGSSSSSMSGGPQLRARQPMASQQHGRIAEMDEDDDDMADFQSELDEGNVNRNNNRPQAQPGLSGINSSSRGGAPQISFGEHRGPGGGNFAGGPSMGGQRERDGDPLDSFGRFLVMPRSQNNPGASGSGGGNNARDSSRRFFGAFGMGEPGGLRIIRAGEGHRHQGPPRVQADPQLVKTLMEMGFTKSQCKAALKMNKNNLDRCIDKLLTNGDQFIGLENSDDSDDDVDQNQRQLHEQIISEQNARATENKNESQQPAGGGPGLRPLAGASRAGPSGGQASGGFGARSGDSEMIMPRRAARERDNNNAGSNVFNPPMHSQSNASNSSSQSGSVPGIIRRQMRN